ncbi:MAG: patatin-like phospholipase family protein [Thermoanaerobaculia bacterium]
MKRACVLGGGGARGSFQVGFLEEIVINQGIDFQILRGVSVGALNSSFLAMAPVGKTKKQSLLNLQKQVESLKRLWLEEIKGNYSVYGERFGSFVSLAFGSDSLYSVEPLKSLIDKYLDLKKLKNSGRDFSVGTVSLLSGKYQEWTPFDENFKEKLLASCSIPLIFPPVKLKEDLLVDGGVRNITPLSSAFRKKPSEIYVFLTSRLVKNKDGTLPESAVKEEPYKKWDDTWLGTKVSGFSILKRSIEILTDEIYLDDIRQAIKWNKILKEFKNLKRTGKKYIPLYILAPQQWYGEDNSSVNFSPELIKKAIEHGLDVAKKREYWIIS